MQIYLILALAFSLLVALFAVQRLSESQHESKVEGGQPLEG